MTLLRYAVIGDPIAHSLSPVMQNAALRELGLNASYEAFHVTLEQLPEFVESARKNLAGFNITVPHKKHILPYLDAIACEAELAGSVNTVTVSGGKLSGTSTDGAGLERALSEEFGFRVHGGKIAFVGCGGAAQAAAVHFAVSGAESITVINRTPEKAQALTELIRTHFPAVRTAFAPLDDPERCRALLKPCGVVIQCTSVGLKPEDPSPFDVSLLPDGICCYDTIYKPTAFLKAAAARGLRNARGFGMLLHQGACSLEIWTGRTAPVEVMRKALLSAAK